MKAAVYHGKEDLRFEEVPEPILEEGEILLKIEACCVCGTDMRTWRNGDPRIASGRILGHEFCGTVVESRAGESCDLREGDRVVQYIVLPCGECLYCVQGRQNLCDSRTTMAYHYDGAFAEFMKIPAPYVRNGSVFKVESDIPSQYMAAAEPLGCVLNAHGRLQIGMKDTVAILGAGPIGTMHAVVARLSGAQKVFMLDLSESRLDMMKTFDVDATIRVRSDGSHRDRVRELTDGLGASVVIAAASVPEVQSDALEIAAKGGRVEFFGGLPKSRPTATLNTNHLHYKEITVTGSFSEKKSDFQAAQALIQSGRFPADKIVTHELELERTVEAFSLMSKGESLKVCIRPNA